MRSSRSARAPSIEHPRARRDHHRRHRPDDDSPARAAGRRRQQPGGRRGELPHDRRRGALHQRRHRGQPRRGRASLSCCLDQRGTEGSFLVSHVHDQGRQGQLVQAAHHHRGRSAGAQRRRGRAGGRGRARRPGRLLPGRRDVAGGQPHHHRPRHAELHEPRALQGHPGRQGQGRLQRSHHRPARCAEDRLEADQPRAAAVRRGDDQLEPAARDFRRRCEVHAWCGGRAARRRGDVLPAGARASARRTRGTC